jgi:site-specific recombinase XerC
VRALAQALAPGLLELSLSDLIDEYLVALEVGGRSRRTIDWYRAFLREYLAFAAHHTGRAPVLADLSTVVARRWLLAEQSGRTRPLSPNSLAGRVRTLKAFGGWVFREVRLSDRDGLGASPGRVPSSGSR